MPPIRLRLDVFNAGDYIAAPDRAGPRRNHLQGALPGRLRRPPARNCACGRNISSPRPRSGSLLPLFEAARRHHELRESGDPAQRYAPFHRHCRADAAFGRRAWRRLGTGLGHHQATFSYTNHTILPEALESWPVPLMERLLPRHMQIIYLINALHPRQLRAAGHGDLGLLASVSLIDEYNGRQVRMGNLAFIGSHKVNGVSALHTELMKETVFHDLHELYPDRIINKTNGITFRRWLFEANPALTDLMTKPSAPASSTIPKDWWPRSCSPTTGFPGAMRHRAGQQGSPRQLIADQLRSGRSGGPIRRADQAHPRI